LKPPEQGIKLLEQERAKMEKKAKGHSRARRFHFEFEGYSKLSLSRHLASETVFGGDDFEYRQRYSLPSDTASELLAGACQEPQGRERGI